MSRKFIQPGHRREFVAGAAYSSGDVVTLRSGATGEIGVVQSDVADTATGVAQVSGVQRLPKAAIAIAAHAVLYWTGTAITTVASGNTKAGTSADVAKVSADTEIDVLINDRPGAPLSD